MTLPDDPVSAGLAVVAERVVQAVASCPAVAGLSGGPYSTVATYLPGRTLLGVAVRAGEVEVCVTVWYKLALAAAAQQVRDAVAAVTPGRTVNVIIGDVAMPGSIPPAKVIPQPLGIGLFEPPGPGAGSPRPDPGPLGRGG